MENELMMIRWGNDIKVLIDFTTKNGLIPDPAKQKFKFIYKDRFGNGYEISYDGSVRKNCSVNKDNQLIGVIENYLDLSFGQLWREDHFWADDTDFPDGKWNYGETHPTNLCLCDATKMHLSYIDVYEKPLIYEHVILPELKGERGEQGTPGMPGMPGPQGLKGEKGDRGEQGIVGIPGMPGPQGPKGDKGDKGDIGITGIPGMQGIKGEKGDKGDKGDTGETGAQGERGLQGIQGPAGPTGLKGDKGNTGDTGPKGERGEKGDKGDTGQKGDKGDMSSLYLTYEGVSYDEETKKYTVNELPNLSESVMQNIYQFTAQQIYHINLKEVFYGENIPTNLRPGKKNFSMASSFLTSADHTSAFMSSPFVKIYLTYSNSFVRGGRYWRQCFYNTAHLKEVIGEIIIDPNAEESDLLNMFNSSTIETFRLSRLKVNFNMNTAPNVTEESVLWILNQATNISPINLTIHPESLERLSESTIALAASKNITITA